VSKKQRHALITGGAGFIGSRLAIRLVQEGHRVTVVDNLLAQVHGDTPTQTSTSFMQLPPEVEFVHGDVREIGGQQALVDAADTVFHLAAETGTGQSMYEMGRYAAANVLGTTAVLEAIARRKQPLGQFCLTSSRSVYGEGRYQCEVHGSKFPADRSHNRFAEGIFDPLCPECDKSMVAQSTEEDDKLNPLSIYAVTKLTQEQLVSVASAQCRFPTTVLRLQNVYGEGQSLTNPYTGILSIFATRALKDADIEVFEDGLESRDFVHVSDVVEALTAAFNHSGDGCRTLNVGTGKPVSVIGLIEALANVLGRKVDYHVTGQVREGDIRHNFSNSQRLFDVLGVRANVSFEAGITSYVEWLLSQSIPEDRYKQSLDELKNRGLLS
jgi:dTDP-L-rhamnose 4-epimerase